MFSGKAMTIISPSNTTLVGIGHLADPTSVSLIAQQTDAYIGLAAATGSSV